MPFQARAGHRCAAGALTSGPKMHADRLNNIKGVSPGDVCPSQVPPDAANRSVCLFFR